MYSSTDQVDDTTRVRRPPPRQPSRRPFFLVSTAAEGFAGGYWVDPVDGEGFGFVLFDTADQARQATPPASGWSAPGVTIRAVDVRRVAVAIPPTRG